MALLLTSVMYRMHLNMTNEEDINDDVDVVYRTLNVFADENRLIYCISDPLHLIKIARNYISKLFNDDLDCGLHLVLNVTNEHIKLSRFSVMISCPSFE